MIKKRQRLSRNEFATLLKRGKRLHGEHCTIIYGSSLSPIHYPLPTPHPPIPSTKCGVVVSKKTAKKAVARNTLRRRVYAILGELLPSLQDIHLAVLLKPGAAQLSHDALRQEIVPLVSKITAVHVER